MPTLFLAAIALSVLAVGASIRAITEWKYEARHPWPLEAALFALMVVALGVHAIEGYMTHKPASWFQLGMPNTDDVSVAVFLWGAIVVALALVIVEVRRLQRARRAAGSDRPS